MKVVSSKRKAENDSNSYPIKRKKNISDLAIIFLRFPQISSNILKKLDNQSLTKVKETGKELKDFIENDKILWARKIKSFLKGKHEKYLFEWERTIQKTPANIIRKLANGIKKYKKTQILSPLHIAAQLNNFPIFKHVFDKVANKNPYGRIRSPKNKEIKIVSPLHVASRNGNLKICKIIMNELENKNPYR